MRSIACLFAGVLIAGFSLFAEEIKVPPPALEAKVPPPAAAPEKLKFKLPTKLLAELKEDHFRIRFDETTMKEVEFETTPHPERIYWLSYYIYIYKKGEARPKRIQDFQTGGYQTAGRDLTKAINSFIRKPGANPVSDEPYIADIDVTYSEATGPVEPKVGPQSTRVLWKETLKLEF